MFQSSVSSRLVLAQLRQQEVGLSHLVVEAMKSVCASLSFSSTGAGQDIEDISGRCDRMQNVPRPDERASDVFDVCCIPRVSHVTGVLDAHDVGTTSSGDIVFVNTRYSCLATTSRKHSFKPIWKPPFISKIVDEVLFAVAAAW
ncbi:MAG: DUF4915 domain-containing protein [Hyphomicrobiaceae bacterium]